MAQVANEIEPLPLEDLSPIIDADQALRQADRATELRRCVDTLLHVYRCEDAECIVEKCSKVKKFRAHIESHFAQCTTAVCMRCRSCKYVIFLAALHARGCRETECPVPLCIETQLRLRNPRRVDARVAAAAMARVAVPTLILEGVENQRLNNYSKVPQCSVCMEDISQACKPTSTPCGHVFCERCINDCLSIYDFCPKCKKTVRPGSCIKLDLFDRQPS